ncbi:secretin [Pseudomonas sp. ZM23]|uniref:Secretin n=1 Tax=Pseudomonas triclosanedens TaxID=2961893 RepID=A0ABY6ZRV0_9PSED|nr:secretin N-terminal domain-containing protein [Pseudomonas triclosanedens]MCP8465859.1 secretin [Pseudomonas triclosanedens]MCP8472180.1 secretin [Pseudomonas triclosanedens]MCP8477158.1 secretin [Pseudomonas triclosanedens]WAI47504.1 secretin [Pseudomonas triclosanedens]
MTLRSLALLIACGLSLVATAAPRTEIIPLNYRTADDVLPVAQSVLGNEGRVTAYGNQLVVNAELAKIRELQQVIEQLDTRPHQLLISVDTVDGSQGTQSGYSVNGSASAGNVEIQSGAGEINGRDQVRIISRSTSSRGGGTQQVRATEGSPAFIQVGQSQPVTNAGIGPYGQVYSQTEYRDANQGMYVTASLSGNLVHLTLNTRNDRFNNNYQGSMDTSSTETRISGPIGQWIEVGGVSESNQSTQSGFARHYSTQGRNDSSLRVKVELLD